jgi:hypothetical protein
MAEAYRRPSPVPLIQKRRLERRFSVEGAKKTQGSTEPIFLRATFVAVIGFGLLLSTFSSDVANVRAY